MCSFGIATCFYLRSYLTALDMPVDVSCCTIIHIPSVNSAASTCDCTKAVAAILALIGTVASQDEATGITTLCSHVDGRLLCVAALVNVLRRDCVLQTYCCMCQAAQLDIQLALGMAMLRLAWPWAALP